ncbi:hypothetical protein AB9K34_01155 [Sedimentitalea sp. XS_ASV28]|uniref:hypothetical protein n=1 Tax=Sedimentitalea sp. XS_ASV28 TaxID=3241296 RepID=UPI003512FA45
MTNAPIGFIADHPAPLARIATLRGMSSSVQVITTGGDKHLIRYQATLDETIATIERHRR